MKKAVWLLSCLMLFVTAACGLLDFGDDACDQDTMNSLRLALPASAADLDESCVPGFAPGNAQYNATFSMSAADLQTFQDGTSIIDWHTDADEASVLDEEATNLESLIFGHYGNGVVLQEILIDISDPQQYRVQIFNAFVD